MDQTTWLLVAALASVATAGVLLTAFDEIAGSLVSLMLWGIFAFGATDLTIYTAGGAEVAASYDSLAFFGVGMMGLMIVTLLKGATMLLDPRDVGETSS